MPYRSFQDNLNIGERGVYYTFSYGSALFAKHRINNVIDFDKEVDHIEGYDIQCDFIIFDSHDDDATAEWKATIKDFELEKQFPSPQITSVRACRGAIEIKNRSVHNFHRKKLKPETRHSNHEPECGMIGFELWEANRSRPGFLYRIMHPKKQDDTEGNRRPSAQPEILLFFYEEGRYETAKPFVAIAFEDVPALFNRLKEIASKGGLDLDQCSWDPQELADFWSESLYLEETWDKQNTMWYVDFDQISDLATVTLIGDLPTHPATGAGFPSPDIQQSRLDYLKSRAGNRHVDWPPENDPQATCNPLYHLIKQFFILSEEDREQFID